jgi:hypothetical protein
MTNPSIAFTLASLLLATGAGTAAATGFTTLIPNVEFAAAMPDGSGLVVETPNGLFFQATYNGTGWSLGSAFPGAAAVSPKGLDVVRNPLTGLIYVFEIESSGLWGSHSTGNGTWSDWCSYDSHTDFVTSPSAAAVGDGFTVVTEDQNQELASWRIDASGTFCSSAAPQTLGLTAYAPKVVSWGGTRVDVFGMTPLNDEPAALLEHWWSTDGVSYGYQDAFDIAGNNETLTLDPWATGITVSTRGSGLLDVGYLSPQSGTDAVEYLSWGSSGWALQPLGYGPIVAVGGSELNYGGFGYLYDLDMCSDVQLKCIGSVPSLNRDASIAFPAGMTKVGLTIGWTSGGTHHLAITDRDHDVVYDAAFD